MVGAQQKADADPILACGLPTQGYPILITSSISYYW